MKKYHIILLIILGLLLLVMLILKFITNEKNTEDRNDDQQTITRTDGAEKISNCYPQSCQNPVFSPDGKSIIITKFSNGYNKGPAQLVKIDLETKEEQVIVSLEDDNVNVPFGSWIGNKIVFSAEEGIATANDDGSNIQIHLKNDGGTFYIEPVFNPVNAQKIVLEKVKNNFHQIALLELDKNNKISDLTDGGFDDRLPSWSPDGNKILWQRTEIDKDNWKITIADINLSVDQKLSNISSITQGPNDTDNSWLWNGKYILSSRSDDDKTPNIFAYSLGDQTLTRITSSEHEDGAPASSPDSRSIAFESHVDKDENSPSEIWLIANPLYEYSIVPQDKLKNVKTYANSYIEYSDQDLEKLKKFDIVMVEPYNLSAQSVKELKEAGAVVIAYISVGEADDERRYWKNWQPTDLAPDISYIPRTTVNQNDDMFIGEDPGWKGSYFVDAANSGWQNIMLNEELPYILALGGGEYDGIVMDLIDVVDEYEGKPRETEMRQGMIDLIKQIKEKYPELIVIPNRGFGILVEMGPYIDGFKFEELTLNYHNIPGQADFETYGRQIDSSGNHQNQEEIDLTVEFASKYARPIFVLDHVETEPLNTESAQFGYNEAQKLAEKYGVKFIWYANSVDQDLPIWPFLDYRE